VHKYTIRKVCILTVWHTKEIHGCWESYWQSIFSSTPSFLVTLAEEEETLLTANLRRRYKTIYLQI